MDEYEDESPDYLLPAWPQLPPDLRKKKVPVNDFGASGKVGGYGIPSSGQDSFMGIYSGILPQVAFCW